MINFFKRFTNPTTQTDLYLKICMILAIAFIYMFAYKLLVPFENVEGFSQKEPFEVKINEQIYDSFMSDMYENLHNSQKRCNNELYQIIKATEPTEESVFLDVGSGTGYSVNQLRKTGFQAYGIEQSDEMHKISNKYYPNAIIEKGNVLDSMKFDKSTFTHVLCNYFTIYELQDKEKFFRNCYYWMKPNSYLIVHLVDRKQFTKFIPHKTMDVDTTTQIVNYRSFQNSTVFDDFHYKVTIRIPLEDKLNEVNVVETFTEHNSDHIRQNENTLYMEPIETILKYASNNGFIYHAKINMKNMNNDEHQYLYIFERPL